MPLLDELLAPCPKSWIRVPLTGESPHSIVGDNSRFLSAKLSLSTDTNVCNSTSPLPVLLNSVRAAVPLPTTVNEQLSAQTGGNWPRALPTVTTSRSTDIPEDFITARPQHYLKEVIGVDNPSAETVQTARKIVIKNLAKERGGASTDANDAKTIRMTRRVRSTSTRTTSYWTSGWVSSVW